MIPDNVIYTDGRNVTITDTKFEVRKNSYKLNGITKYGMYAIKPRKLPGALMVLVGLILAVIGFLGIVPSDNVPAIETEEGVVSANVVMLWIGIALTILGVLILAVLRKRYAVRIDTAEGERNAVVSRNREYISQIVDALGQAMFRIPPQPETRMKGEKIDTNSQKRREKEREKEIADRANARKTSEKEPVIYRPNTRKSENDIHHHK